jgi:predicted RNA binding protein YcfA (HicA-like mRNA interferase family)
MAHCRQQSRVHLLRIAKLLPIFDSLHARYNSEMKVRAVIRRLKNEGWHLDRSKGSHRQFRHLSKKGLVTVPGKPGDDLAPGTLSSIFKQAGWK